MNKFILISALCCLASFLPADADSLRVTGVQRQIAGSTTDIPVNTSGTASNFSATTVIGNSAIFDISSVSNPNYGHLRVTYAADDGGVGPNIMIARTTNSQNLMDNGTVSVLITTNDASVSAPFNVDLTFDWFTYGSFIGGVQQAGASLIVASINYTSFDIDFNQLNAFDLDDVAQYTLNGNTLLTATDDGTKLFFEDSGANSTFNDVRTAYQVLTVNQPASHTITMGKQSTDGNALFMFEFRDPSQITVFNDPDVVIVNPIPEPSTSLLCLSALASILLRRSRS